MKKSNLKRILLPSLFMVASATGAQAHTIPVSEAYAIDPNDPAFDYLRDNGLNTEADGVALYCQELRLPADVCTYRLGQDPVAAKAAAECAMELTSGTSLDPTAADGVLTGVNPKTGKEDMVYHDTLKYSPELGWHYHGWSPDAEELAGRERGDLYVDKLKLRYENLSSSSEKEASASEEKSATGKVGGSILGSVIEFITGTKGTNGESYKASESQKGPSKQEIDTEWKRGYEDGRANPQNTSVAPDQLTQYAGDKNHPPKPGDKPIFEMHKTEVAKQDPSKQEPPKQDPPKTDDIIWPDSSPMSKSPGTVSMDPADGGLSPLEHCQAELFQKKRTDLYSDFAEPTEEYKSLKQKAEEALKAGTCMPEWFGANFCRDFYAQEVIFTDPNSAPTLDSGADDPQLWTTVEPDPEAAPPPTSICDDPSLSEGERRAHHCNTGTGADPWCQDPRATLEEKIRLSCPGYAPASNKNDLGLPLGSSSDPLGSSGGSSIWCYDSSSSHSSDSSYGSDPFYTYDQ